MARQNSKYFSSVIEQLIADKHKENIVVDESFKMSLRGKVMERAAMMPRMEVLDDAEAGGFAGFVNRWKYALALVPSVLLVMVVASQVMNMPVGVESDVVVEQGGDDAETLMQSTTGTSEELRTSVLQGEALTSEQSATDTSVLQGGEQKDTRTSEELRTSEVENNNVGVGSTSEVENNNGGGQTKKIKTFPGALVMPVGGGLTSGQNATGTSEELRTSEVENSDVALTSGQNATRTSEELRTSEVETSDVVYSPAYVPDRTGSLGGDVQFESSYRVTTYEDTERVVENDKSLVVAGKGDSVVVAQNGDVAVGDGVGGGVDEQPVGSAVYVTRDLVVPSLAVPMELPAYNVTYETSLSGTEKSALETNVIVPLTEGRDVQRTVVGRDGSGYVLVTVFYGDGSSVSKTYSYNSSRGVWDTVTYVQPVTQTGGLTYKIYKVNY